MLLAALILGTIGLVLYNEYIESKRVYPSRTRDLIPELMNKVHMLAYSSNEPVFVKLQKSLGKISIYSGSSSYTVDKQHIYLCLSDRSGNFYDMNTLMDVVLHEVSHVICDELDHTAEFNRIFRILKAQANVIGIYDSSIPFDRSYCSGCGCS